MSVLPSPSLADCIRTRRTVMNYTGESVPHDALEKWLELACCAPNHRMSQPWRFAVLNQSAITRLGTFLKNEPTIAAVPDPEKGAAKLAKLLERLSTIGALIQVTWVRSSNAAVDLEDHAAASAAVQNLLLAAHADGWASFWSTNPALGHPETLRWCGLDPAIQGFVGSIWFGRSKQTPTAPPRVPLTERVRWL
jgi:nitroreductase